MLKNSVRTATEAPWLYILYFFSRFVRVSCLISLKGFVPSLFSYLSIMSFSLLIPKKSVYSPAHFIYFSLVKCMMATSSNVKRNTVLCFSISYNKKIKLSQQKSTSTNSFTPVSVFGSKKHIAHIH